MRTKVGFAAFLAAVTAPTSAAHAEPASPVLAVFQISDERPKRQRLSNEQRAAMTDFLRSQLAAGGKFQVVPPTEVQQALRAKKADSYEACYDEACQIEIGKEVAAEKSLATKIARIGSQCLITSTMYDLARGATETSAPFRGKCKDDDLITGLESIASVLRGGGPVATQGFARARVELGALAPMKDFSVDTKGASFAGIDVTFLKLVQAAKRLEKDKKVNPTACAKAWQKVAGYKGKNPLAKPAKARADYWQRAQALFTRYRADKSKLDELLKLDDDVLGPEQKTAAEAEFQGAYAPYVQTLDRLGLAFPWLRLSNGAFCPRGAKVERKTKTSNQTSKGKTTKVVTEIEQCTVLKRAHGLTLKTLSTGPRYEIMYRAGKKHGRWLKLVEGRKRLERFYRDGKKHGVWRTWTSEGALRSIKDKYVAGKLEGVSESRRADGSKSNRAEYVAGQRHGLSETWHTSGERRSATPYKAGKKHGKSQSFRKDGSRWQEVDYVDGKKAGLEVQYHRNGKQEWRYQTSGGKRNGPATRWYDTGEVWQRRAYAEGKREGAYTVLRRDGSKLESGTFRGGKLDGAVTKWDAVGSKTWVKTYRAGKVHGPYTQWSSTGVVINKETYRDGKRDGLAQRWYPDGRKKSRVRYRAGKADGQSKTWRRSGKIQTAGAYVVGKREGVWRYYRRDGQLESEIVYAQGKLHGLRRRWYENGKLQSETRYLDGKLHGEASSYSLDGELAGKSSFDSGTGKYRGFSRDGTLNLEGRYVEGKKAGPWTSYFPGGRRSKVEVYEGGKLVERKAYRVSGKLALEERFVDGQREGRYAVYDLEGTLVAESNFEGGTGDFVSVDREGRVSQRGRYEKGKQDGTWTVFRTSTGKPDSIYEYRAGQNHGEYTAYFESGALKVKKTYRYGTVEGPFEERYESGGVRVQGQYAGGQRHGTWRFFDEGGQRLAEQTFVGGTGTWLFFEGGKRRLTRPQRGGSNHGVSTMWHDNGRPFSEVTYVVGSRHGPSKGWYDDGKKMWAGENVGGKPSGIWTYWDKSGAVIAQTDFNAERYVQIAMTRAGNMRREDTRRFGMRDGRRRYWDLETGRLRREYMHRSGRTISAKNFDVDTGALTYEGKSSPTGRKIGVTKVQDAGGRPVCQADFGPTCPAFTFLDAGGEPSDSPRDDPKASKRLDTCRSLKRTALSYCPP